MNFDEGIYLEAYHSLYSGTGTINANFGNDITRRDYSHGYTLFAYDLTPDVSDQTDFNLIKEGNIRLELCFGTALPTTVNVTLYAEFENMIEIDRN